MLIVQHQQNVLHHHVECFVQLVLIEIPKVVVQYVVAEILVMALNVLKVNHVKQLM
jgi:hypothetical protein